MHIIKGGGKQAVILLQELVEKGACQALLLWVKGPYYQSLHGTEFCIGIRHDHQRFGTVSGIQIGVELLPKLL